MKSAPEQYARGTHSPCIGICLLDPEFGTCQGCGRTGAEIGDWATTDSAVQSAAWDAMPNRLQRSSRNADVLQLRPWSPQGILQWAADKGPLGAFNGWRLGCVALPEEMMNASITIDDAALTAVTETAAFLLKTHDKLRAFAYGPALAPTLTVLTLPKGRVSIEDSHQPTLMTSDEAALLPAGHGQPRLDLGLNRNGVRYALRGDAEVIDLLVHETPAASLAAASESQAPVMLIVETECARSEQPLTRELLASLMELATAGTQAAPLPNDVLPGWAAIMAMHQSATSVTVAVG